MNRKFYLFLSIVLIGCTINPMYGHWLNEETETKIGLILINDSKCTFYVSPPNHSSFAGNCEYELIEDKYYVYSINDNNERWPQPPFIYEYSKQANTLVWLHEEGRIELHKQ